MKRECSYSHRRAPWRLSRHPRLSGQSRRSTRAIPSKPRQWNCRKAPPATFPPSRRLVSQISATDAAASPKKRPLATVDAPLSHVGTNASDSPRSADSKTTRLGSSRIFLAAYQAQHIHSRCCQEQPELSIAMDVDPNGKEALHTARGEFLRSNEDEGK